ncbi:MAG: endolytic transglycosylase MltG [Patescibacteria group bacterium]|nr:endolytic transglycosylase MltG [Patescibacteria group bacterium]
MNKFIFITICCLLFFSVFLIYFAPCYSNGIFEIQQGENLITIAENLKAQGYIQSEFPFYAYVALKQKQKELKSGVYFFSSDDTFISIAEKIINGDTYTIKITIPEGFNLKQIQERLINPTNMGFNREELLDHSLDRVLNKEDLKEFKIKDFKNEFDFLASAPDNADLQGFLFPDTYYFYPRRDTKQIINIFLNNFDKKMRSEIRQEIKNQNKTIFDTITMASLLEKEVRSLEDKKIVSGILWKRLKINMPLQICATIVFITDKKSVGVSIDDTKIDSPYNTYKYRGLPIGPICSPGIDSIKATLYPEHSEYLYYLSTPDKKTIFSKTLKEHNIAKAKYLK